MQLRVRLIPESLRGVVRTEGKRNVIHVVFGTALAQGMTVAATPVLTRIYSPAEYGVFALYLALVGFLGANACLRYNFAVPLPEDDESADRLVYLSMLVGLGVAAIGLGLIAAFADEFARWLGEPRLAGLLWLVPLGVAAEGLRTAFRFAAIRRRDHRRLAQNDVGQAAVRAVSQIGLGMVSPVAFSLMIGDVVARTMSAIVLSMRVVPKLVHTIGSTGLQELTGLARRYKSLPMMSAPATALNSATMQLPVILLAQQHGPSVAGLFALAQRIVGMPIFLVAGSIGQVYLGRAAEIRRTSGRSLETIFRSTTIMSFIVAAVVMAPAVFLASFAMPSVLGRDWADAGGFVRILLPMYVLNFVATATGPTLLVLERQDVQLARELLRFIAMIGALVLVIVMGGGPRAGLWAVSTAGTVGYAIYVVTGYNATRTGRVHGHDASPPQG